MANEALEVRRADPAIRALDMMIAVTGLALLSPGIALLAVAIRLTSRGPAFYRGERVGRGGRIFVMFKFRTLRQDAEERLGPYLGLELTRLTAAELTPVGRWLRSAYLDEVPQLWNVVRGEMSIVGPRPIRSVFFEQLCAEIPQYWQRLVVPPGITGFAQLRLPRDLSWREKLAHDLEYVADRSVKLYLSVVAATLGRLLVPRPRVERVA
ncbi:MAG TPA: sugar transferase [Thermoleophilaceae bacterium]|nr:sugar transferase [Thermoleophilaceae bacterium]